MDRADRKNKFDIKYEEYLEYFKNNPNYSCDFELKEKLSIEELYQKFIECRDKLSQKERIELQQINNMSINLEENIVDFRK